MNDTATDDEIVEVFVEEAGEVFQNIDTHLPIWSKQPDDSEALTEIRRGFHTLKGSGRMVDAVALSDVAWKVENMLNRMIDGSVEISESLVELVSTARNLMPEMLDAFKNHRPVGKESEIEALKAQVDALATGQMPPPEPEQLAVSTTATPSEQPSELDLGKLDRRTRRLKQRCDEALHRSEIALQQAQQIATRIQELEEEDQDRVNRAEVNPIIERVNLLAKEVMDLHREVKQARTQRSTPEHELNHLIDRRIRERIGPIEHQRLEHEQQLAEAGRASAASRTLAWWALILSVLIGGGAVAALLMMSGLTWG